jgi:hypothetical protein
MVPTAAHGQPTLGTYSYSWTRANDATNTPITSINVTPGSSVSVRFWLHEAGGGQALSATNSYGLGGYDASYAWNVGGTAGDANAQGIFIAKADGTNAATAATTDVQVNPLVYGTGGFNNTNNGLITNTTAGAINTAKSIQIGKLIGDTTNPANYVKVTNGPNSTGNILLTEMTFTTSTGFTGDTLTGAQRSGTNYLYFVNGTTPFALDTTIGTSNAVLQFVPVPEPTIGIGVMFGTVGLAAWFRRRSGSAAAPGRAPSAIEPTCRSC